LRIIFAKPEKEKIESKKSQPEHQQIFMDKNETNAHLNFKIFTNLHAWGTLRTWFTPIIFFCYFVFTPSEHTSGKGACGLWSGFGTRDHQSSNFTSPFEHPST
jgi:hypothetical protein